MADLHERREVTLADGNTITLKEFIEEELSETGRARGREITEESEQFHLGWEAALVEAKS